MTQTPLLPPTPPLEMEKPLRFPKLRKRRSRLLTNTVPNLSSAALILVLPPSSVAPTRVLKTTRNGLERSSLARMKRKESSLLVNPKIKLGTANASRSKSSNLTETDTPKTTREVADVEEELGVEEAGVGPAEGDLLGTNPVAATVPIMTTSVKKNLPLSLSSTVTRSLHWDPRFSPNGIPAPLIKS